MVPKHSLPTSPPRKNVDCAIIEGCEGSAGNELISNTANFHRIHAAMRLSPNMSATPYDWHTQAQLRVVYVLTRSLLLSVSWHTADARQCRMPQSDTLFVGGSRSLRKNELPTTYWSRGAKTLQARSQMRLEHSDFTLVPRHLL